MALAVLAGLAHRHRTGEGQWIDMSCTEAGLGLTGPDLLDYTVNERPLRRPGMPDSNHSDDPAMAPHDIYPTASPTVGWPSPAGTTRTGPRSLRCAVRRGPRILASRRPPAGSKRRKSSTACVAAWTSTRDRHQMAADLRAAGVPAAAVAMSEDRIDHDPDNAAWGLFPTAITPRSATCGSTVSRSTSPRPIGASPGVRRCWASTTARSSATWSV